jgi:Heparinase II/III N-terminus/Heparinase II/III-like protein
VKPQLASTQFRAPFDGWSPAELLAHFQRRDTVRYFPIVDETQTGRAKSDQVLSNRFDLNEEAYELRPGFDWTANPSADVEWLILLHKFYYAAGLGVAFDETKDRRYAEKWAELTDQWIAAVPLDFMPSDVAGRRIQNWISAHYYFVTLNRAPNVSPDFYLRFLDSLRRQVEHLKANLTPARNHRTLELWAIFQAAVVFPEFRDASEWLEFANRELLANAQSDLLSDGVQCELSTDYHHIALRNFLYAIRLAALNGIEMPADLHRLVRRALEFSLYAHKPDGWIPALSDGDTGSFLPLLKQGYELYGDKAMLYVATKGKQGRPPASRSRGFEQSGYYILRSGWGEREPFGDERYLIFDCGPLGAGNHGHLDLLSFEMSAYGQSLIVDPGRFTYHEPPPDSGETNWRALFRGTGYHNTVLVDGKNQTRYEFHKGKFRIKGEAPQHELKAFVSHDGFDYLHGVARSREYEVAHERKIVFLCPDYWLVVDRLLSEAPHDYRQLFHLSERAYGRTSMSVERRTILIDSPRLIIAHAAEPDVAPSIKEGFVSPAYGVKRAAPVVSFARRTAGACYHTVLYPYKADRPEITVERLPVQSGGRPRSETEASALRVTVTAGNESYIDVFLLIHRQSEETYQCGPIHFRGKAMRLRTDSGGRQIQRRLLA